MKKVLTLVLLLAGGLNGFSQSQLFSENFESASSAFTLNTADLSSTASGGSNLWLINNSYTGGSGTLVCMGFPFSFTVPNTVAQPGGITNSPNSKYLHITSQAALSSGVTCANYIASDGFCNFDENNFAKMSLDISTIGLTGISLDFWSLCGGSSTAYGEVYYSINGGNTWVLQQSNYSNINSWTQSVLTNPAWNNQATLRFGFRFVNQTASTAADPGFCVDDIKITNGCNQTTATISQTACNSYTSPSGNYVWTSSNTYLDTIPNAVGCDSVITVNLTVLNSASGTDIQTACDSYTWIDGNTYTSSNNSATFNIVGGAANGCDSLVTLNLTISTVSTATTVNGLTIQATNASGSYRWLNCNANYSVISGETSQSYTASSNGSYAVEITENNCVDTSACVTISTVSLDQNDFTSNINVYPNPTKGKINVELGASYKNIQLALTDISGKLIYSQEVIDSQEVVMDLALPTGIYFLNLETENGKAVIRLVKE